MNEYDLCPECNERPRVAKLPVCRSCWEWMWEQEAEARMEGAEFLLGEPLFDDEADYEPVTFRRVFMWIGRKGAA